MLLSVTSAFPTPVLVDAGSLQPPADARLILHGSYVLLSPFVRILDALTLLDVTQHILLILTLLGLSTGLAFRRGRTFLQRLGFGALGFVAGLAAAVAMYAAMAYLPRPMPRMELHHADDIALNLHAHSQHSHDVGDRYTVEWSHAWHARAGYDAFVLSDHSSWDGMLAALSLNPARAGDGVTVLDGVEVWVGPEHVIALGDSARYAHLFDPERRRFLPELLRGDEPPATLITTIPGDPFGLPAFSATEPMGVVGVEIHDGAPRGLEQARLLGDSIRSFARTEDLALVSGWNNHGAGQTPTAWTVMRLPGWQDLAPPELLAAVERTLHDDGFAATRVLERPATPGNGAITQVLVLPALVVHVARSLTVPERLVWLLYLLGLWLVGSLSVRSRHRGRTT